MTAVAPEKESTVKRCYLLWQDKQGIPWWLGISYKGIGQYDLQDKLKPRKVNISSLLRWHLTPLCFAYPTVEMVAQDTCEDRCFYVIHRL